MKHKHEHEKPDKTKGSEQEQDQGEQLRHIHHHLHQPVDQRVQELKNTTSENPKPHEFSPSKKIKLEKLKISKVGGEGGVKNLIEKVGRFREKKVIKTDKKCPQNGPN